MRSRPLSASSVKIFLQCVLKYYFRYEEKKPREGRSDPLAFGIAVHAALEYMWKEMSNIKKVLPDLYERTVEVFTKVAVAQGLSDMNLYQEGRDMIRVRLDNADPGENVLGLELSFNLTTPKGTPFTGSIDKLIELDPTTALIIDYKTSRTALSQDEADIDIQFSMYDLAVSILYPQYKTVICVFDYLRLPEVMTHRDLERRLTFIDFLDAVYEEINKLSEEDISANLNFFCPWCEFKLFCPAYKEIIDDPKRVLPMVGDLPDADLVEGWELVSAAKQVIDSRQREFKMEAAARMRSQAVLKGKDKELFKVQASRVSYDPKTVFEVVGSERYIKMSSVNKSAVDKYLIDNPEAAEKIDNTSSFAFNSPSFRIRKSRKDG